MLENRRDNIPLLACFSKIHSHPAPAALKRWLVCKFVLLTQTILPFLLYMSVTGLQAFTRWGPVENSFLQFIIKRTIKRIGETVINISHEVYKSSYRVGVRLQGDQVLDLITDTEGYCVHRISAEDYGPENMAFCKYFECFLAVLKHGYS